MCYGMFWKGEVISQGVIKLSKKYIKGKVIDLGAGNGALIKRLSGLKGIHDIIGIELDRENKALNIRKGDITKLDFNEGTFDTIFCTDVIEHLNDLQIEQTLGEIRRICKVGGHVVFTTLFEENLETKKVACPDCGKRFHPSGHIQSFTHERLVNLLETHKLKVLTIKVLHLGGYSISPVLFNICDWLQLFKLSVFIEKLVRKDVFIIATPIA